MKHRYLRLVGGPIVALLVLTATTPVGAEDVSSIDRFQLWHACQRVTGLYIPWGLKETPMMGLLELGLTQEAYGTAISSGLRALNLHTRRVPFGSTSSPTLFVEIEVRARVVYVRLEFGKQVLDPISGERSGAGTWSTWWMGSGDAAFILSQVSRLTEEFADEYLRVNASACQGLGQD